MWFVFSRSLDKHTPRVYRISLENACDLEACNVAILLDRVKHSLVIFPVYWCVRRVALVLFQVLIEEGLTIRLFCYILYDSTWA